MSIPDGLVAARVEEIGRRAFAEPNPYLILGASPADPPAVLSTRASEKQERASSSQAERLCRNALRELCTERARRLAWGLFTPHVAESDTAVSGAADLAGWLLGGAPPDAGTVALAERFARFLGGERGMAAEGSDVLAERWRCATHRYAARWEYWHQLALIYQCQAEQCERELAAHELGCEAGTAGSGIPDPEGVVALTVQSLRCWERVLAHSDLRPGMLALDGGDDAGALVDAVLAALPRALARCLGSRIEQSVEARNRVASARRARTLRTIAGPDQPASALSTAAAAEWDNLRHRLWPKVRALETDSRVRFEEIYSGLLLLYPTDPDVALAAFQAMVATANEEGASGKPDEAIEMCRRLEPFAESYERVGFPRFPDAGLVDESRAADLGPLHAFHLLLGTMGSVDEAARHEPYLRALEPIVERLE